MKKTNATQKTLDIKRVFLSFFLLANFLQRYKSYFQADSNDLTERKAIIDAALSGYIGKTITSGVIIL